MKRIYAVIELDEGSTFDPSDDDHLDELADDLLRVAHGVSGVTVYTTIADLVEDEQAPA